MQTWREAQLWHSSNLANSWWQADPPTQRMLFQFPLLQPHFQHTLQTVEGLTAAFWSDQVLCMPGLTYDPGNGTGSKETRKLFLWCSQWFSCDCHSGIHFPWSSKAMACSETQSFSASQTIAWVPWIWNFSSFTLPRSDLLLSIPISAKGLVDMFLKM